MQEFMAAATLPPPRTIFRIMMEILFFFFFFFFSLALAKLSSRAIFDGEISVRKNACYADIDSGLRGERCRSSMIAKENCALRCVSPHCYELIYESDPLEEGERDYRAMEFKYCMKKLSQGEALDGVKGSNDVP